VTNPTRFVLLRGRFILPERLSRQRRFKRALRDKLTLRTGVWGQRNLAAFGRVNTSPDWKSASRVSSFPSLFDPSGS